MRWRVALLIVAVAAAFIPIPPRTIEAIYSDRLFPVYQIVATSVSNRVSFALFDVLALAAAACWLLLTIGDIAVARRSGWLQAALRIVLRTATIAAVAYIAFLLTWGFNYRRVRLEDKVQFDSSRISADAAAMLAGQAVGQLNALYEPAHRMGWVPPHVMDRPLADAFALGRRELGSTAATLPGVPKSTLLDPYFRRAGVAGMTDPYFLETFVASDLLPFGWLSLYSEVVGGLDRRTASEVNARLDTGPRQDLRAIRDRLTHNINPRVSAAGWRIYDQYLKANSVEAGAASYADVVRLVLGTKFGKNWKPQLK
jgi:hypothetical protein